MNTQETVNEYLNKSAYKMTYDNGDEGFMFALPPIENTYSTDTYVVMLDDKKEIKKIRNLLIYLELNRPAKITHVNEEERKILYNIIFGIKENSYFLTNELKKMN